MAGLSFASVRKAVLKPPHSKRYRACRTTSNLAKRLECGAFTAALPHQTNLHVSVKSGAVASPPSPDIFTRRE